MKLNISDLKKRAGASEKFRFTLEPLSDTEEVRFEKPIRVEGKVTNTGQFFELSAHVQTELRAACCKCLDEVVLPIEIDFSEKYFAETDEEQQVIEGGGEATVLEVKNDLIDLAEAVRDNIFLSLPMRVLCSDDCPGLCPVCGCNLKEGQCQCRANEIDPRLAVLAKLMKE